MGVARIVALAALLAVVTGIVVPAAADDLATLRKDVEDLKAGQAAIQRDLAEIKALLRRAAGTPEPSEVVVSVAGDTVKGRPDAPVTLVEFSDFQCPFCARHYRDTFPQLERDDIATGKLRYAFRHFPIESLHPQAFKGHEAALCAGEQGRFWDAHTRLFAQQRPMAVSDLIGHARALGLDVARFTPCLESGKHAARVRRDIADGTAAGVRGTPSFFLGATEGDGSTVKATRLIRGAQPYAAFRDAIDKLLAERGGPRR